MKQILTVILSLSLAACLEYPSAAIQQPATLTPTATNTTPATASATATAAALCRVTADALHVRSGPGVEYTVVSYLQAGDIVTIKSQRGAWYDIGRGWINSHYCER